MIDLERVDVAQPQVRELSDDLATYRKQTPRMTPDTGGAADNSDDEDGFRVEIIKSTGIEITTVDVPADAVSYLVSGLQPTTYYTFRVQAFNAAGNSAWTAGVLVLTANG